MHRKAHLGFLLFIFSLGLGLTNTAFALDCPDFISEDWDDKPTCAWIRNDTLQTITITAWKPYQDTADLNDDYWRGSNTVIPPGELRVVVGLDNDGWGVGNYDTVRGKSTLKIGGSAYENFVYMEADIVAGVVHDFEYSLDGSTWVDGGDSEIRNVAGQDYKFIVQDEWNYTRAVWDVFFTVSAQTTSKGNMGYLPPDTSDDPKRINVMNYNTYLLMGPSAHSGKLDYCDRAQAIADNGNRIFANVDILVMEELASQDACTPDAEDLATGEHLCCGPDMPFQDRTYLLNGEPLANGLAGPSETGGVVIMSRYPDSLSGSGRANAEYTDSPASFELTDEIHYIFREDNDECFGSDPIGVGSGVFDCAMDKGFLRVKFTKEAVDDETVAPQDYYIVGTHAQAEDCTECAQARTKQFDAIERYTAALPSDVPIIIVGDTNTERDEINGMLTSLNAAKDLPPIHNSKKGPIIDSENYSANYYSFEQREENNGKYDQFDWVLYSNHGLQPSSYEWRNLMVRDSEDRGRADMSDHEAVLAEFSFHPASLKVLMEDKTIFRDGEVLQPLLSIPDNGTKVKKVITTSFTTGASLIYALSRVGISHPSDGDLGVDLSYYPPGAVNPTSAFALCVPDVPPGFIVPCDLARLDDNALINLDVIPWGPSGRWELEVYDGIPNGQTGSLDWFEITLNIEGLSGESADDTDGDGVPNLDDRCPLDTNNTCNNGSQDVAQMTSNAQVSMFAGQSAGQFIGLRTWPGSLASGEAYFFAEKTSAGSPGYGLLIDKGSVIGIRSVKLTSSPDSSYGVPIGFRISWADQNDDGLVDGTLLPESQIRLAQNGVAMTGACENEGSCYEDYGYFDFNISSDGEFLLFVAMDSDEDGVPDNYDGIVDNCPSIANALQEDADFNGVGDACQASNNQCSPDSITLSTQAEADLFQTSHGPACTSIAGNLVISGADISDLSGLSGITSIGGYLKIENNDILTNLDGLSDLTSVVAQTIDYQGNNEIIYSDLSILNNPLLSDCQAVAKLLDLIDDAQTGPGPGPAGIPDIGGTLTVDANFEGCNSHAEIDTLFRNSFQ